MSHSWLCYDKQKKLTGRLRRQVTLEEVHLLCSELGFTNPEDTLAYIETAPVSEIEEIINRAKRRKKKRRHEEEAEVYEYSYAYVK